MSTYIISSDGTVLAKEDTIEVDLSEAEFSQLLQMSDAEIAAYARDLGHPERESDS